MDTSDSRAALALDTSATFALEFGTLELSIDMGKIILVRHGESEANRDRYFAASGEVPLTDLGRQQANEVARRIAAAFQPSRLLSSVFVRARQTAEIIASEIGLHVEVVDGVHERDFGILKGLPYERLREVISGDPTFDPNNEWLWTPPEGESRLDVQKRVIPAVEELRDRYPHEEVLLVCHGVVMVSVWAHLTGSWHGAHIPSNCGMVIIEHESGEFGTPVIVDTGEVTPSLQEASEASVQ